MSKICNIVLAPNGEPSHLYRDLQTNMPGNRPLANLIYATYIHDPAVKAAMDAAHYKQTYQQEHTAKDVMEYFHVHDITKEVDTIGYKVVATNAGFYESTITSEGWVDFDNAFDAYAKAKSFNDSTMAWVAYVTPNGAKYNIRLEKRHSGNQHTVSQVEDQLAQYTYFRTEMTNAGIDMDAFEKMLPVDANPAKLDHLLNYLSYLRNLRPEDLTVKDIKALLTIGQNNPQVLSLVSRVTTSLTSAGVTVTDTTSQVADYLRNGYLRGSFATGFKSFADNALTLAKRYPFDIAALKTGIKGVSNNYQTTGDLAILTKIINDLDSKYGINKTLLQVTKGKISTMELAATQGMSLLQVKLNELRKLKGVTPEGKQAEQEYYALLNAIEKKDFYRGMLGFLNGTLSEASTLLNGLKTAGEAINLPKEEYTDHLATAYMLAHKFLSGYENLIISLAYAEDILDDANMDPLDKNRLKLCAESIYNVIGKNDHLGIKQLMAQYRDIAMVNICELALGTNTVNSVAIADIIAMDIADSSFLDGIRAATDASNPIMAAAATVVYNAQTERDIKALKFAKRINEVHNKFRKASGNKLYVDTSFMYEGFRIISPYDWDEYNKAYSKAKARLTKLGLKGLDLKQALENWVLANTVEKPVCRSGRTERVPNDSYLKAHNPLDKLTKAQREYYDKMMDIKGEFGECFPDYARKQYIAPQVRKNVFLLLLDVAQKKIGMIHGVYLLLQKLTPFKIWDTDTEFKDNGRAIDVDGEEYLVADADYDGSPLLSVPIFYVNRLKDSSFLGHRLEGTGEDDLRRDFTGGMLQLMTTAVNYEAMHSIVDKMNLIKTFASTAKVSTNKVQLMAHKLVEVFKPLSKASGSSRLYSQIDDLMRYQMYNDKLDGMSEAIYKAIRPIMNLTSERALPTNMNGWVTNLLTGLIQDSIEAGGGKYYTHKALLKAYKHIFGDMFKEGVLSDILLNDKHSLAGLINERFDVTIDDFQKLQLSSYGKNIMDQAYSGINIFAGYSIGEFIIHKLGMYARLYSIPVVYNGKKTSLLNILYKEDDKDGNSYLRVRDGATFEDGSAVPTDIYDEFYTTERRNIQFLNQLNHGAMNDEMRGVYARNIAVRCILKLRQWMVQSYLARFAKKHFNGLVKRDVEGYQRCLNRILFGSERSFTEGIRDFQKNYITLQLFTLSHWRDMKTNGHSILYRLGNRTDDEVYMCKKAITEYMIWLSIVALSLAVGDPDQYKGEGLMRFLCFNLMQQRMDTGSMIIFMIPLEAWKAVDNVSPVFNTFKDLLYPIYGAINGDMSKTIIRGDYAGENKWWHKTKKAYNPWYYQIKRQVEMRDKNDVFLKFNRE